MPGIGAPPARSSVSSKSAVTAIAAREQSDLTHVNA